MHGFVGLAAGRSATVVRRQGVDFVGDKRRRSPPARPGLITRVETDRSTGEGDCSSGGLQRYKTWAAGCVPDAIVQSQGVHPLFALRYRLEVNVSVTPGAQGAGGAPAVSAPILPPVEKRDGVYLITGGRPSSRGLHDHITLIESGEQTGLSGIAESKRDPNKRFVRRQHPQPFDHAGGCGRSCRRRDILTHLQLRVPTRLLSNPTRQTRQGAVRGPEPIAKGSATGRFSPTAPCRRLPLADFLHHDRHARGHLPKDTVLL